MNLRNVAIIAHVDHGKTTLVDGLLKQSHTFRENEPAMFQNLILDSNAQERERGITILAKNTAIIYKDTKINIIDTPGHADFSGEVERTLNMANGAILVIDAQDGPMPQTKFVLKKALELDLRPIVVINKIDKRSARVDGVLNETYDLFLDLAKHESQLDFPIFYAVARDGKVWASLPEDPSSPGDLTPLFEGILRHVPPPETDEDGPFQMLVASLDWDSYQGKYAIGRIRRGVARPGLPIVVLGTNGTAENARIDKVMVSQGLKRLEVQEAVSGDIVAITGFGNARIGDTISDVSAPEALPTIEIGEPTLKIAIYPNVSPFAGREGQFVTARQLLDRIYRELETNVSLRFELGAPGEYIVSGRGELHLSVFIETLRREGYELEVGKPHVVAKEIDGILTEPVEELVVDVGTEYTGSVMSEVTQRRGLLIARSDNPDGTSRLDFEITTRGLIGLRSQLLTLSRGTASMSSRYLRHAPQGQSLPRTRNGALVASESGKALTYGLNNAQARGITFIPPQTQVYQGMIVGLHARDNDLPVNVCKEKKQTNVRSSTSDIPVFLTPYTLLSLEQSLDFLEDDELLEVTPKALRLRKRVLDPLARSRESRRVEMAG